MSHLTLEALARLVDESPDATEASHLDECSICRRELAAMKETVTGLSALPDTMPPPAAAWPALEARLREEGLITSGNGRRPRGGAVWLRLAAGVVLFLLGGMTGFALRARLNAPQRPAGPHIAALPPGAAPNSPEAEEAARALAAAEDDYLAALKRYAETSAPDGPVDPLVRLAALEDIVLATRQALTEAPADPLLNGYHLTALAQREATLERIVLASDDGWY
ncbi:MAG TPA: hypothetical protein VF188_10535 [Longimicrobiales bacterium]